MTPLVNWSQPNTEHGLLVAFGEFFQQHGLLQQLLQVPIRQKTRGLIPPAKLIELLSGIMSGMEFLSDLNDGPHPLAKDETVARVGTTPLRPLQQRQTHARGLRRANRARAAARDRNLQLAFHPRSGPRIVVCRFDTHIRF